MFANDRHPPGIVCELHRRICCVTTTTTTIEERTTTINVSALSHAISLHPLFKTVSAATRQRLNDLLVVEQRIAGEVIFQLAEPGDTMYFLCTGRVRFVTRDNTGAAVILEEVGAGDVFGEVALYSEGLRTADAVTVADSTLLVLDATNMNEFLRVCPEVSEYLLKRMASRLSSSNRMLRKAHVSMDDMVALNRSKQDRSVKRLVNFFGTLPFFFANVAFTVLWLTAVFTLQPRGLQLDTEGFDRLSAIQGIAALLITILVLMNQSREAKEEAVRDKAEFEATLHADAAINHLHEKVDVLTAEIRRQRNETNRHKSE
jgi:CRP-like cAMP-binding protein